MSCDATAYLDARLAGALDAEIHWRVPGLECDGMSRPDGRGLRVRFEGTVAGERLTLVFGAPALAEGASGRAIPVNVTLIREGGRVYGTRGSDGCTLDEVRQQPLDGPAATTHRWAIEARGFCLAPARGIVDTRDEILLSRFDFRGQLSWDPPTASPPAPPAAAP